MVKRTSKIAEKLRKKVPEVKETISFEPVVPFTRLHIPILNVSSMFVCFLFGYFSFSVLWVLILAIFGVFIFNRRVDRFRNRVLNTIAAESDNDKLESHVETTRWLNLAIKRVWDVYEQTLSEQIVETVNQVLDESKPGFIKSIKLTQFTLGSSPPAIKCIKAYPDTESDQLVRLI